MVQFFIWLSVFTNFNFTFTSVYQVILTDIKKKKYKSLINTFPHLVNCVIIYIYKH